MTEQILIVFGVLAGAVVLFASGRVRPDVVAILVVLALNLSGVLTIQESLAGFGQPVVVLIAAVSIVGEGLIATGVTYRLGEAVMKAGGSNEARLVALVMVLAGTVSSGADQRYDDLDRVVAEHDRRRHPSGARSRPVRLLQLDAVRGRSARHRHRLYADRWTQHAEQADRCRGGRGQATEHLRPTRVLWPRR